MGRIIRFDEKELTLKLTGFTSIAALKREVKIPYPAIKSAIIDTFKAPFWMLRMPGTCIPPYLYEGSFRYENKWYFLSYEHKGPHVILELAGHERYHYVIFEIDQPEEVVAEIRKHIQYAY
ncbi:hypothetical protein WD019_07365 [Fictibacillus sp. Mic-4]|uniref:hypothetical protein n=1 Tax=Fictibacillus TaxID=1329200 RepID=UPI0003FB4D73|nr:hypothetical protein [Fictibacillus gelatini]